MKKHKAKREGLTLDFKTFKGKSGKSYLVFHALRGGYHVFVETEAKDAAFDCGAQPGNTRELWKLLWDSHTITKREVAPAPRPPVGLSLRDRVKALRAAEAREKQV